MRELKGENVRLKDDVRLKDELAKRTQAHSVRLKDELAKRTD